MTEELTTEEKFKSKLEALRDSLNNRSFFGPSEDTASLWGTEPHASGIDSAVLGTYHIVHDIQVTIPTITKSEQIAPYFDDMNTKDKIQALCLLAKYYLLENHDNKEHKFFTKAKDNLVSTSMFTPDYEAPLNKRTHRFDANGLNIKLTFEYVFDEDEILEFSETL